LAERIAKENISGRKLFGRIVAWSSVRVAGDKMTTENIAIIKTT